MAITWQNVNGPALPDAGKLLLAAGAQTNNMFSGLEAALKERQQAASTLFDKQKTNNLQNFYSQADQFTTPEALAEAQKSGAIKSILGGYGTDGIDQAAVRQYLESRPGTLQQRALTNQQYTDQKTDIAQRPALAGYQGALAETKTPEGVAGLMESIRVARGANVIDPRAFASLMKDALGRNDALVNQGYAAENQELKKEDHASQIASRGHQQRMAEANLRVQQATANEARIARAAASNESGLRARTAYLDKMGNLIKEQTAAAADIEKSTPYAVNFSDKNSETVRTIANTLNGTPKYGVAVLSKLTELSKKYKDGIPLEIVTSSLDMAKSNTFDFLNRSDGYAGNVAEHIESQMKDPKVMEKIAFAKEVMAKARGQYNGSTLEPDKPAPVPAASASPPPLPPQLKSPAPLVSESGSLIYNKPGSFNISANKGIMVPSSMPTGSMDVTVKDGDTINVKGANGVAMDFRFNGLDAQETAKKNGGKNSPGQKYSEEAKAFITQAFKAGKVDIRVASNKPDSYGRHVADVYVNGENLNEALLRRGLATVLKVPGGIGPSQNAAFTRLQEEAMRNNLGIMGDLNSDRSPTGAAYRMFGDNLYK